MLGKEARGPTVHSIKPQMLPFVCFLIINDCQLLIPCYTEEVTDSITEKLKTANEGKPSES
jgi:hypothetical protein